MLTDADGAAGEERVNRAVLGIAGADGRAVWLEDWRLAHDGGLRVAARIGDRAVALRLTPLKPALAVDPEGGAAPFRGYALPRLAVEGTLGDAAVTGLAWLDHLWGDVPLPVGPVALDRWQIHLRDGSELSITRTRRRDGRGTPTLTALRIGPDGAAEALDGATMVPTRHWHDPATGAVYPVGWRLAAGALDLALEPVAEDAAHAFMLPLWSGAVRALSPGGTVLGTGSMQLTGYAR